MWNIYRKRGKDMVYDIQNYVKLLCIRIDHFESHIVDEKNTTDSKEAEEFINRYQNREGLKILMIQMANMEITTFDEVKKYIHNAHVFDYIRHFANDEHELIPVKDIGKLDMNLYLNYMLNSGTS